MILGHKRVNDKSNEITAIPEVLNLLAVKGCIVTIDAMGCQTDIASQIYQQGGDYVLALKENQRNLYRHAVDRFDHATATYFNFIEDHDYARTVNKGHGRVEIRECWLIRNPSVIAEFREQHGWSGLHTLVKVRRQREIKGVRSEEVSYYISSLQDGAATVLQAVRRWCVVTGQLKMSVIGYLMSFLMKIAHAFALVTARKTSLSCAILPFPFSNRIPLKVV